MQIQGRLNFFVVCNGDRLVITHLVCDDLNLTRLGERSQHSLGGSLRQGGNFKLNLNLQT
jgi:hypothetical protein